MTSFGYLVHEQQAQILHNGRTRHFKSRDFVRVTAQAAPINDNSRT